MDERQKVFLRTDAMADQAWAWAKDELGDIQRVAFAMMRGEPLVGSDLALANRALMLVVMEVHYRNSLTGGE